MGAKDAKFPAPEPSTKQEGFLSVLPEDLESLEPSPSDLAWRGKALTVSVELHAKWARMVKGVFPLIHEGYPAVDDECAEKGLIGAEAVAYAEQRLHHFATSDRGWEDFVKVFERMRVRLRSPHDVVWSGERLVITREQHEKFKKLFPGYDPMFGYAIADAECEKKGLADGAAITHAKWKLGYLASDWKAKQKPKTPEEEKAERITAALKRENPNYCDSMNQNGGFQ
jgi:hypothetical protein